MLSEQRLANITEMENVLNQATDLMAKMDELQQQWQHLLPQIERLTDYYFNGLWSQDYDAYSNGEIPKNIPCGILSQDAVYDFVLSQQGIAQQWITLAQQVIPNEEENEK